MIPGREDQRIELEHLAYTWAEHTLTGSGHGVVLRSIGWPTTNDIGSDAALANMLEYVPSKFLHRLSDDVTPPSGVDFWDDPELGHVVAVRRYLGKDSAGRPGRFLVHLLLNKTRQLTATTAYSLAQSKHIITDWPFTATPVRHADPLVYIPPTTRPSFVATNSESVRRVIAGIIEIISQGQRIVFTQVHDTNTQEVLGSALALLPEDLTRRITFSTYRGIPSRGTYMLSFASATFSDPPPTSRDGRQYIPLEPNQNPVSGPSEQSNPWPFTAKSDALTAQLIDLSSSAERFPAGLGTLGELEKWLEVHSLTARPASTLSLHECAALLSLPAAYSPVVRRERIVGRMTELAADTSVDLQNPRAVLELLQPAERSALEAAIHSLIIDNIERAPAEANRLLNRAATMGFSDDRLGERAVPAIGLMVSRHQSALDPTMEHLVTQLAQHIPPEQLVEWAENPAFHSSFLSRWEPTAHTISERSWSCLGWFSTNPMAARGVASRFREESIQVLTDAISGDRPTLAPISRAVRQDYNLGSTVLTDILLTASRNPQIPAQRLYALAEQQEMPAAVRDQLASIAERRTRQNPLRTSSRAAKQENGSAAFPDPSLGRRTGYSRLTTVAEPFPSAPTSPAITDAVSVHAKFAAFGFVGKLRSRLKRENAHGTKKRFDIAGTSQPIASVLCAVIGYLAGSVAGDVYVAMIAAIGVLAIISTPHVLRRRKLHRRLCQSESSRTGDHATAEIGRTKPTPPVSELNPEMSD